MADVQIVAGGTSSAPLAYTVPGAQEIILKALFATFDGTGAGGAFLPCVRIIAPGGKVVGEYVTDSSVAAGSSAEVSFAPFLRGATAAAAASTGLNWMIATSVSKSIASGFVATTTVDFTGGLTTNAPTVFALATNGDGTKTPYVNAVGVYAHFMEAQLDIGLNAPAAGSIGRILSSAYGNEPFGTIQDGLFYVNPQNTKGICNPCRQWISGLNGGSSPPDGGTIGIRQNSTFNATTLINFMSVQLNTVGANIV